MPNATEVLGAAQAVIGTVQSITGNNKLDKLVKQRSAYKTPQQVYDILNLTKNMASQGYDPETLSYLTGNIDASAQSAYGAATRLGADPNSLSEIFSKKIQGLLKVGSDNHELNMRNVSAYLAATNNLGDNLTAEWKSREDILKDKIQAAAAKVESGRQNIQGGLNTFMSGMGASQTNSFFTNKPNPKFNGVSDSEISSFLDEG